MRTTCSPADGLLWTVGLFIPVALISCVDQRMQRDDALGRAVKEALYDQIQVNLLHVDISTTDGVVYLSGEVDTYQHKEEAERLAREVEQVVKVVNKVQVQP